MFYGKLPVLIVSAVLSLSVGLSACARGEAGPAGDTPGVLSGGSPSAAASPSPGFSSPAAPSIVFHDTIDDPQSDYLNTLGGGVSKTTGTAGLDLVLCETRPGVFEGFGVMTRSVDIAQGEAGGSAQKYVYRTGLVHAEAGKEERVALTGWLTDDSTIPAIIQDAPFSVAIHKDATLRQEDLPLLLKLDGNRASLSIRLHDHAEFVFHGELTPEPPESPVGKSSDPGSLIYINSLWSGSFSGGGDGGDYTAVLLASPEGGRNGYAGRLSVQGTGNALENIEEDISFTLEPFDAASYREAGGRREDRFSRMGILRAAKGDFILLLDGEQAFLEPAGKEIRFCGSLRSPAEYAAVRGEADKTTTMLSYLYREKSGTAGELPDYSGLKDLDPGNPEDMQKLMDMSEELAALGKHDSAPDWYPGDLIPMVNFSAYDGFFTLPPEDNALFLFRIYDTSYGEEEDFEDLVEPYRAVLSGYDDYKEYLDYDHTEGVFLFTMGKYTVQVHLCQHVIKSTTVKVLIY